ncbi:MAG TPA: hypothetical protein VFR51_18780 [Pyrinomonadaceae bacterium]|nr:hypothetical protein [Pyrinomonadaceae bacterium]
MAISITNRTKQLLIMELNNGEAIYLAPDRNSEPIDESLVNGNEKFSKLLRGNLITSTDIEAESTKQKKTKPGKQS